MQGWQQGRMITAHPESAGLQPIAKNEPRWVLH
jgi:hypothetical protein